MANIFLSHSSVNKSFVRRLATDLRSVGHTPWLDEWEIRVGDSIISKMQEGLLSAEYVAVVLTAQSSAWVEQEWKEAYWSEVTTGRIVVLPLLLERGNLPVFLRTKRYADFSGKYLRGFAQLLQAIVSDEARQLRNARLSGIENSYFGDTVPWGELFARTQSVVLMFNYARSWREKNEKHIHSFLARSETKLAVILPNPDDSIVIEALQHQHDNEDGSSVQQKVGKAVEYYRALAEKYAGAVEVVFIDRLPSVGIYMFDREVVFTLNPNRPGRRPVPTFVADHGGDLYNYFHEELSSIMRSGR